jgi:hypothetical protein
LQSDPLHAWVLVIIPTFNRRSGAIRPCKSAIMNMRVWLRGLGLGRYEKQVSREEDRFRCARRPYRRRSRRLSSHRTFTCFRGDVLLTRSSPASVPAEEAFQTAIAMANGQGPRGYALLASLPLAKLYQSTGRPDHARAILAPAHEGLLPTPEMPEIAQAWTLLGLVTPGR